MALISLWIEIFEFHFRKWVGQSEISLSGHFWRSGGFGAPLDRIFAQQRGSWFAVSDLTHVWERVRVLRWCCQLVCLCWSSPPWSFRPLWRVNFPSANQTRFYHLQPNPGSVRVVRCYESAHNFACFVCTRFCATKTFHPYHIAHGPLNKHHLLWIPLHLTDKIQTSVSQYSYVENTHNQKTEFLFVMKCSRIGWCAKYLAFFVRDVQACSCTRRLFFRIPINVSGVVQHTTFSADIRLPWHLFWTEQ